MRKGLGRVCVAAIVCAGAMMAAGQVKVEKAPSPAHLELTAEVAATTDEGYPSVLRITIKNVGNVAVDMPMPKAPCVPGDGGVMVRSEWRPSDPEDHTASFSGIAGCAMDHFPSLKFRVAHQWIRLRPGEFIVISESLREDFLDLRPGTVTYWVQYIPPRVPPEELIDLQRSGFVVPIEKIETAHQTFVVH